MLEQHIRWQHSSAQSTEWHNNKHTVIYSYNKTTHIDSTLQWISLNMII